MNKQSYGTWVAIPDESTLITGMDHVALLIEWDEPIDEPVVEEIAETQITRKTLATRLDQLPVRTLAAAIGALGALGLAAWGIRRLRAA
jgi:hypothetical protein